MSNIYPLLQNYDDNKRPFEAFSSTFRQCVAEFALCGEAAFKKVGEQWKYALNS